MQKFNGPTTAIRAYRREADRFRACVAKPPVPRGHPRPISEPSPDALTGKPGTQAHVLATIKGIVVNFTDQDYQDIILSRGASHQVWGANRSHWRYSPYVTQTARPR
jgi:hypothetical protein